MMNIECRSEIQVIVFYFDIHHLIFDIRYLFDIFKA
jgi:hypothetical protein